MIEHRNPPRTTTPREPWRMRWSGSPSRATAWRKPLALVLCLAGTAAALDEWRLQRCDEQDKRQHFGAGAIVGATTRALAQRFVPDWPEWGKQAVAIGAAALVGAAKEAFDSRHPANHDASCADFLATTAGGAAGSVTVALTFRWTW